MSACTVMLVGTCGAGKSTLGNFLLFEKPNPDGGFDTGAGHQAVTTECKTLQDSTRPGPPFTVIDTPGIPDPDGNTRAYFDCIVQEARKKGGLNAVVYAINYSVDRTAFERNIENAAILLEQFNKIGCVLLIACRVPGHLPGTSQSGIQAAEQKWNNYVADISSAAGIRSSSTFFLPLDILSPSRDIRRLSTRFSAVNITGDRGMRTFGELKYCAEQRRNVATRHVQLGNDIGRLEKENQTLTDNVVEQARSVGRYDLALRMGAYSGVVDGVSTAIGASQVAAGVAAVETAALVYVGTVAVAGAILGVVVCALIRNDKHKDIQIKKATIEANKDTITAMTRELMTGQINVDLLATDEAILRKLDAVANKATSA